MNIFRAGSRQRSISFSLLRTILFWLVSIHDCLH